MTRVLPPPPAVFRFARMPKFDTRRGGLTTYLVYLVYGEQEMYLGAITSTTPSPYPGRSKASYDAYPALQNGWTAKRSLGVHGSRDDAGKALLVYLHTFKYWRGKFARLTG